MNDAYAVLGEQHEANVAWHLRALPAANFRVFNQLRLNHGHQMAQIDHLILHKYGFVVVESKRISGQIRVNAQGEWHRSVEGLWQGMPSPLQQARAQAQVLKQCLCEEAPHLLGRILGLQKNFGARRFDVLCALSSHSVFEREGCPSEVSEQVIKTEWVVDTITALYQAIPKGFFNKDPVPAFSVSEIEAITGYLMPLQCEEGAPPESITKMLPLVCKHCGATPLAPASGQYGYYGICACGKNTSMKGACGHCRSRHTTVQKRQHRYIRVCEDCGLFTELGPFTPPSTQTRTDKGVA